MLFQVGHAQHPGHPAARGVGVDEQRVARTLHALEQQRRTVGPHRLLRQGRDLQHRVDLARHPAQLAARLEIAHEARQVFPGRGNRFAGSRRRRNRCGRAHHELLCAESVGQRRQPVAVAGRGKRLQRGDRLVGQRRRLAPRALDAAHRADLVQNSGHHVGRHAVLAQVLAHAPRQRRVGLAGQQHRQRQLALLKIVAHRLAGRRFVDGAVQHVIGDLEGTPQRAAVAIQRSRHRVGHRTAHARAPGDQRGRLAVDDAEVLLGGGVRIAGPLELGDLALGHLGDRRGQRAHHRQGARHGHRLQRAGQAEVTDQDHQAVAEHHPRGRPPAADSPVVDHVVVVQRGGVNELGRAADRDPVLQRGVGGAGRQHGQQRAQPLAARPQQVRADLRDGADRALHPFGQPFLDGAHLVFDQRHRRRDRASAIGKSRGVQAADIRH